VLKELQNKMNTLVFSFVVGVAIAVLCVWLKGKDNKENNGQYAIKVFAVSSIVVFVVHTYLMGSESAGAVCPEIEVGEPPF
jgi:FtsH-binding integral membrane protein